MNKNILKQITQLFARLFQQSSVNIVENKEIEEMKYLIVGLGNIGDKYASTRHNIGFEVADALIAEKEELLFKQERYAAVAKTKFRGRILVVIKPATYMNLSGNAIRYCLEDIMA